MSLTAIDDKDTPAPDVTRTLIFRIVHVEQVLAANVQLEAAGIAMHEALRLEQGTHGWPLALIQASAFEQVIANEELRDGAIARILFVLGPSHDFCTYDDKCLAITTLH